MNSMTLRKTWRENLWRSILAASMHSEFCLWSDSSAEKLPRGSVENATNTGKVCMPPVAMAKAFPKNPHLTAAKKAAREQYTNASHGLVAHFLLSLKRYFERAGPGTDHL